jgi:hypothetical protein
VHGAEDHRIEIPAQAAAEAARISGAGAADLIRGRRAACRGDAGGSGGSRQITRSTSSGEMRAKRWGRCPLTSSYSTEPRAYTSVAVVMAPPVTWTGGRETWETWAAAKGMAEDLMRKSEGVSVDSIVAPGPVQGLGDAAIYSELVPALVLKGDMLLEMNVFYLPNAKSQFRGLAELMLGRL